MNGPVVMTYPAPPGTVGTDDFRVEVEGRGVFVYHTPVAAFACFAFSGSARVTVAANRDVDRVDIRPQRHNFAPSLDGRTISFTLTEPCKLSVEINADIRRPLFLFADAPEDGLPDPQDENVRHFAPGRIHDIGEINLQDGETVCIPGGAVVRGWIRAERVKGARIIGHGILDGSDPDKVKAPLIAFRECEDIEVNGPVILNDQGWTVVPVASENVAFTNIKLIGWNDNSDGIDIVGCKRVTVDNSFLRNKDDCISIKANHMAEGRDVEDVRILNSVFWNAEWGNALEIGFELCSASVSDVLFVNCDIIHVEKGAAFSIHNGDFADVRKIGYEDIRVEDARDKLVDLKIGLSIYSADCPERLSRSNPDRERSPWGQWIPQEAAGEGSGKGRGRIRDIRFKDIQVTGETFPGSQIEGFDDERAVENITFENLYIHGKRIADAESGGFVITKAENVQFTKGDR